MSHFAAIEETGDIPYELLKPILEKCSAMQLRNIESINPVGVFFLILLLADLQIGHRKLWRDFFFSFLIGFLSTLSC